MPTTRALIAFASRYGSTAEIAEAIARELGEAGFEAEAREAAEVETLDGYGVVVLGSAVYLGRWRPEARAFVRRFEPELGSLPVWLFSSGPLERSHDGDERLPPRDAARLAERIGARGHAWFGGVLSPEADGLLEWLIIRTGRFGDFRDFGRIRAWVSGVATSSALTGEPLAAP